MEKEKKKTQLISLIYRYENYIEKHINPCYLHSKWHGAFIYRLPQEVVAS